MCPWCVKRPHEGLAPVGAWSSRRCDDQQELRPCRLSGTRLPDSTVMKKTYMLREKMKNGWVDQNRRRGVMQKWTMNVSCKNVPCLRLFVSGEWRGKVAEGRTWKWLSSPPASTIVNCHGLQLPPTTTFWSTLGNAINMRRSTYVLVAIMVSYFAVVIYMIASSYQRPPSPPTPSPTWSLQQWQSALCPRKVKHSN